MGAPKPSTVYNGVTLVLGWVKGQVQRFSTKRIWGLDGNSMRGHTKAGHQWAPMN